MKIFLTGGTGYLGSALLAALLNDGHEVTALTRRPREEGAGSRLKWVQGDLADGLPPTEALHQCRAVVHSAALVKTWVRDPALFDTVNVQAWDGLLDRCSRLGVTRILHTSSFLSLGPSRPGHPMGEEDRGERSRFLTHYERTKYLADRVTDRWLAKGVPVITLYPTVLFGPGSCTDGNLLGKMIFWIAGGRFPGLIGSGRPVWNLAYLPDVIAGHLLALARALPGKRYILGGENVALNDLMESIYRGLGRAPRWRKIPLWLAESMGSVMEWGARFRDRAPELTRGVAGVYRNDYAYRTDRAERDLGYRKTDFGDALARTIEWAAGLKEWSES